MSIFEGLIKPTVDTTVNTNTDMSEKTQNVQHIHNPVTYNIGTLVIADKDVAERFLGMAVPRPIRAEEPVSDPSPAPQE